MESLEAQDKKAKLIQEIRHVSRKLHEISSLLYDCDRENPEVRQTQLEEAANSFETLLNQFAANDYLNSVCLKVFAAGVQVALKSFLYTLQSPTIVRAEDMH